jgi:hypothetical protein
MKGEVIFALAVPVVMVAFDGGFFDRPVQAFGPPVGPRMLDLGQPVRDFVLAAAHVEHVRQWIAPLDRPRRAEGM